MNLIVDIGNTRVKVAVMDNGTIIHTQNSADFDLEAIGKLRRKFDLKKSILSSTRGDVFDVGESIRGVVGHCLLFDAECPVPIANNYLTPETLGRDRLAAAIGATIISKADNQLVIDVGTAITIDLVTRDGGFEGGFISPGVMMRYRALHEFTASLPLCSATMDSVDIARTTQSAIEHGVMEGIIFEIDGHIDKIRKKIDKIDIIFAGGDLKYFENRIKNTIFASGDLVFAGLNRILEYNA